MPDRTITRASCAILSLMLVGCPLSGGGPSAGGVPLVEPSEPPTLESLSSSAFLPGDRITLNGHAFHPLASLNEVFFEGASASAEAASPEALVVRVPAGVRSGALRVATPLGMSGVAPYVVDPPEIASISVTAAYPGKPVTLWGRHFSPVVSENQVSFNGVRVTPISGGGGMLVVVATGSPGPLTVRTGAGSSAALEFVVIPPLGGSFQP
ncbi:IPT/TIG domain protein [compost metagenome]